MTSFLWFIVGTALVLNLSGKTPLTRYPKMDKGCVYVHIYIFSMIHIYVLHRLMEYFLCFRKPVWFF